MILQLGKSPNSLVSLKPEMEKVVKEWARDIRELYPVSNNETTIVCIDYRMIDKVFAKIMTTIELLNLPEKQESAIKKQIRDNLFSLTEDASFLNREAYEELQAIGYPLQEVI